MKFLAATITAFMATAVMAMPPLRVQSPSAAGAASALLRTAIRVDRNLRRLDQNNNIPVTVDSSIQFNQCVSLTTEPQNADSMFADDTITYTQQGRIVSQKSYVLFTICEGADCFYDSEESLYLVDLMTYMQTLLDYKPTQIENYCTACQEAQNWCLYDQYNQQGDDKANAQGDDANANAAAGDDKANGNAAAGDDNANADAAAGDDNANGGGGGGRRLKNNNGIQEVVDCNTCASMNCFVAENDGQNQQQNQQADITMQGIAEWANKMAECQDTGVVWGNQELYGGFICNAEGSGVELALFLDEECSVYMSLKSYASTVAEGDGNYEYYYNSQDVVTYPFTNAINCSQEVEYITPEQYANEQANGNNNNNQNNNNNNQANDYCTGLFGDDTRNLYDCNADGAADEQQNEVQADEEANYDWYTYILSQQEVEDPSQVCVVIQTMQGEYTIVYNNSAVEGSGSFYSYPSKNSKKKKGGKIALIIILVLAALIGLVCVVQNYFSTSKSDSRKERLIGGGGSNKAGQSAMT